MTRIYSILALLIFTSFLTSCSSGKAPVTADPKYDRLTKDGTLLGDGITFGGDSAGGNTLSGVAVNAFLWRASLDTISFMPLNQVDPFGGVIITDWYSPPKRTNERFKLNVYILSQELRSDGLRVSAFKETRNSDGQWQTANISKDFSLQMEDSILIRARQMRVNALENKDK